MSDLRPTPTLIIFSSEDYWNWDDIKKLDIESIAAPRSFVFLWCGSTDGLDYGRQCLQKWGFRRCEDICWIKTNFKKGYYLKKSYAA